MDRADRAILGITLLLTAGPPLIDVAHGGVAAACRYSAADSFYYHTVARNLATRGYASYDGVFPTNGFHPLWQVSLGLLYKACSWARFSDRGYLVASIVLSIALVTVSVGFFCRAFLEAKRHLSIWMTLLPVGAYGLLMAPVWYQAIDLKGADAHWIEGPEPLYGTMWSLMNGMESPLALAMFGWIALRFARASSRRAEVDAACLALMTLARLDLVFVALPLLANCTASAMIQRQRRQAFGAIGIYGATIGAYLLINRAYAGVFMPSSGAVKSSFPHLTPVNFDALKVATTRFVDDWGAFVLTWRITQLFLPAAGALVLLPALVARYHRLVALRLLVVRSDRLDRFLAVSGIGVLALFAYNFCFVHIGNQGHWYFAVSIAWLSLAVVSLLDRMARRGPATSVIGVVVVLVSAVIFMRLHRRTAYRAEQAYVLSQADTIRQHYVVPPKLLEFDDGLLSFATGFQALGAFGFAVDSEAARAAAEGHLARLAYDRGFSGVAVFSYNRSDYAGMDRAQVANAGAGIIGGEFDVTFEYALPHTRLAILSFHPK